MNRAPDPIQRVLGETRRRWFRLRLAEGLLALLGAGGLAVLLAFHLDNWVHLPGGFRLVLALGVIGLWGWIVVARVAGPLTRPLSRIGAALRVERRFPALKSRLINTVLFEAEPHRVPAFFRAFLRDETALAVARVRAREVVATTRARRLAGVATAVALAWIGYATLSPLHLQNALARYINPLGHVRPLASLHVVVLPGDVEVVRGEDVAVSARVLGPLPPAALLTVTVRDEVLSFPMRFEGDVFRHVLVGLREDCDYRVTAGNHESPCYRITVVTPPGPAHFRITYRYPGYTGWSPRQVESAGGAVDALTGTHVDMQVTLDRPVAELTARLQKGGPRPVSLETPTSAAFSFPLRQNDRLSLRVKDTEGLEDRGDLDYGVRSRDDLPPAVNISEPLSEIPVTPDQVVSVVVRAQDDVGLKEVALVRAAEGGDSLVSRWPGEGKEGRFSTALDLKPLGLSPGQVVHYYALAVDLKGTTARSRVHTLRVESSDAERRRLTDALASILERLARILEQQKLHRGETERLLGRLRTTPKNAFLRATRELASAQTGIRDATLGVLHDWSDPILARAPGRARLAHLAAHPMVEVVKVFEQAGGPRKKQRANLQEALGLQTLIIQVLTDILADTRELARQIREVGPAVALRLDQQRLRRSKDALEKLAAAMKGFIEEQRQVIQTTESIRNVRPADFTGDEKEKLDALAAIESKWGELLKEAWTDLSKLYPQDFSNSSLSSEILEAYSEVELAADALTRRAVELAVPYEQSGLELAESITQNIERWLDEVHDHLKWNMEEPTGDFEVPLADLPEELEDLIGDLIDSEDAMSDASEDVTSGWMDSLNEGAGWTAMDGPISNMSAKGVTGNLLPNSSEIGGRSGEGRTGKSLGQMVEKTASGKGGRQTPTRYTPDPFEGAEVKDTAKDPTGGATGGGKLSGSGAEGLRGVPSPLLRRRMQSLAGQQAAVRQQAERLEHQLKRRRFHSLDLQNALALMKAFERDLLRFQGADYAERRKAITRELTRLRTVYEETLRRQREAQARLPRRQRESLRNALDEEPPREYRGLIEDYYRALTRETGR